MVYEIAFFGPVFVDFVVKDIGYVIPLIPSPWCIRNWDQPRGEAAGNGDFYLFAVLNSPDKARRVLTQLS